MLVAIGAFDAPATIASAFTVGRRGQIAYVDHIHELPAKRTLDDATATHFLANLVSYQHPDHDTDEWPPA